MRVCVCVCEAGGDKMATGWQVVLMSKMADVNTSDHVWSREVTTLGLSKTMVAAQLKKNLSAKNMGCVSFVTLLDSCCIRRSLVLLHSIYSIYYLFIKCGSISFKR